MHEIQFRKKNSKTKSIVATTVIVFVGITGTLAALDLLPQTKVAAAKAGTFATSLLAQAIQEDQKDIDQTIKKVYSSPSPEKIVIDSIDLVSQIGNPTSTDIAVLDKALFDGVVHYPDSGDLEEQSNMLLFGHSSSLPFVRNQNFKIFNKLKDLDHGALIRIQSATHEHLYSVDTVRLVTADEAFIPFDTGKKQLTLSTCNSFGKKSERWVITAKFLGKVLLPEELAQSTTTPEKESHTDLETENS